MKSNIFLTHWKVFFIIISLILFGSFNSSSGNSSSGISGTPHFIYGRVFNSDGTVPDKNYLEIYAYIPSQPDEILDKSSVGCGKDLFPDGVWLWFEAGNFPTPWSANEKLRIIVIDNFRGETGAIDLTLDTSGNQLFADLILEPGDNVGPIAHSTKVDGLNPASIPEGKASIILTANLDDSLCGNNNVQVAEYFIDTDPGFGLGTIMTPKDGSFNSPLEEIIASVNTSSWKEGETRTIYVRGQDIGDNWGTEHMVVVSVTKPVGIPGDLDGDGDVDQNDLNILLSFRNKPASACPKCDLDGDGMITVLDARKLVLLCTRPRCATK